MAEQLYKILAVDGSSVHGGPLRWNLPTRKGRKWVPGDWHSVTPPISVCSHGLHLVTEEGLIKWYKPNTVIWAAEGAGLESRDTEKVAFEKARLLSPADVQFPIYWRKAIGFIETGIPLIPWFEPDGKPLSEWKLFEAKTLAAALAAAWAAARDAAGAAALDAAGAAAWAAALVAQLRVCHGLKLDKKHKDHIKARWQVWQKGYALLCDVNGVLYVYAQRKKISG